ncbi:hypothetical protein F5Y09DRAFT_71851 [Xylaria sp. FL1042]|nr:hypothetical protein F5Y09DRAFT_71851 [Xylaria sp. FL1042]
MNNFGVIEIASAKTTNAPGWAYVPDRQPHHHLSAATTSNRKRARAAASAAGVQLSLADANARQEAKARREIEILDRDNARDVQIAIPAKAPRTGGGGKKYTPNVRRILQSQKTFANHLDDYIALLAQQAESNTPTISTNNNTNTNTNIAINNGNNNRGGTPATSSTRSGGQRQASASAPTASRRPSARTQELPSADVEMVDIQDESHSQTQQPQKSTILTPYPAPPAHAEDTNALLASRLPPIPSDDELRALLSAPPLSYLEARGTWPSGGNDEQHPRYPTRVFCAVCGYWGRVRCMKCGTRVCALECLETHQEDCITRYGL